MRLDRGRPHRSGRSDDPRTSGATLPITADQAHGTTNLATIPYAGNISSDTRAGR
jgi:hypothetical protein